MNGISKSFSKFYYYIMLNNNLLSFADGKNIKAVFFDMDGVLFDSMPYHAQAWQRALSARGLAYRRQHDRRGFYQSIRTYGRSPYKR